MWNIIISKQKAVTTYIIFEEKFWFFLEKGAEMQWNWFVYRMRLEDGEHDLILSGRMCKMFVQNEG